MPDAAQKDMDVDAFLAWAEGRTRRWELRDGKPVMMAPARALHALAEYEAQKWRPASPAPAFRAACFPTG